MRTRTLGNTGIVVSEIGFGAWGIGGWTPGQLSYGRTDDATSRAALGRALELGYTFIDTAPLYGIGHSEELVGAALRGCRQQAVVATKAGYLAPDAPADYSPAALELSLTASLRRLGTDYVDLLQLHSPPIDLLRQRPEIVGALEDLRRRGLIRSFGLSANSPAEAAAGIRELGFPVVQANFSMLDIRAITDGLFDAAKAAGAAVIARTPLCFGFLTGEIDPDCTFPPEDHRSRWNGPQVGKWVRAATAVQRLAGAVDTAARVQAALRFTLSFPEVAAVIPGIMTPEEAEQNALASAAGPLPANMVSGIVAYNRENNVFGR